MPTWGGGIFYRGGACVCQVLKAEANTIMVGRELFVVLAGSDGSGRHEGNYGIVEVSPREIERTFFLTLSTVGNTANISLTQAWERTDLYGTSTAEFRPGIL